MRGFVVAIGMAASGCGAVAQQVEPIQLVGKATLNTDEGKFAGCGIRFFGVVPDGARSGVVDGSVSFYRNGYTLVKAGYLLADMANPSADPKLTNFPVEWVRASGVQTLTPNRVGVMKAQSKGYFMYGADAKIGVSTIWAIFAGELLTVSFKGKSDARHVFSGRVTWSKEDQEQVTQCMGNLMADMKRDIEASDAAASAP